MKMYLFVKRNHTKSLGKKKNNIHKEIFTASEVMCMPITISGVVILFHFFFFKVILRIWLTEDFNEKMIDVSSNIKCCN